jgi:A/G-specific adenine glycosylase
MLQQTTVASVIPYYARFMARFPTVHALAAAEEDAVLSAWSGLGYYSRARNLRLGAQFVTRNHGGRFPTDIETAMGISGVGRYIASAVTSIAYGTRAAVVDGNVQRVLSRLHAIRRPAPARAQELATGLLSARAPGPFNEAMMELGATICLPTRPRCRSCPVSVDCKGRSRPEHWSAGKPRRPGIPTQVEMALVKRRGRILLVRNQKGGLLQGLYELPHAGLPRPEERGQTLRERYRGILHVEAGALTSIRHVVTHHRIEATIFRAVLLKRIPADASFHSREDLLQLPLGGMTRKAIRAADIVSR